MRDQWEEERNGMCRGVFCLICLLRVILCVVWYCCYCVGRESDVFIYEQQVRKDFE
jgi:hypothetical protein